MPAVDLFPLDLRQVLPPLNSQEGIRDPIVYARFFTPDSDWIWYVTEGSAEDDDFIFFGFVVGVEEEWGQFSLSELYEVRGPSEQRIERDLNFKPACLSEVLARDVR
jgi:hypothetical protein